MSTTLIHTKGGHSQIMWTPFLDNYRGGLILLIWYFVIICWFYCCCWHNSVGSRLLSLSVISPFSPVKKMFAKLFLDCMHCSVTLTTLRNCKSMSQSGFPFDWDSNYEYDKTGRNWLSKLGVMRWQRGSVECMKPKADNVIWVVQPFAGQLRFCITRVTV